MEQISPDILDNIDNINASVHTVKTLLNISDYLLSVKKHIETQELIELSIGILDDVSENISRMYDKAALS